jgi:D-alanyl-D-alanine carboxypeptidase
VPPVTPEVAGSSPVAPALYTSRLYIVRLAITRVESVADQLEAIVATGVPGSVAVALGPDGRVEAAAGFADLRTGEALTVDHRFRVGSVTKIFVAALVLQLVAEGLLDLDGDAAPFAEGITIRQLLNHTSGLPDFVDDVVSFFEPYRRNPGHRWELGPRDELGLVMEKPRLFPPGEGWSYHGSNYLVLRLVVEETTGVTLREALQQRIFAPLGLRRTDLVEAPLRGDCARGYLPPDNPVLPGGPGPVDVTEVDVPFHRAGGGVVSTAGEIAKMLRAQLGGELLPERLRTEMLRAVESDWEETDRYGLGIGEITALMGRQQSPCGAAWGHLGFSVGYTAIALSSEDSERQVVICANGNPATVAASEAFWDAAGRLAWQLYCM